MRYRRASKVIRIITGSWDQAPPPWAYGRTDPGMRAYAAALAAPEPRHQELFIYVWVYRTMRYRRASKVVRFVMGCVEPSPPAEWRNDGVDMFPGYPEQGGWFHAHRNKSSNMGFSHPIEKARTLLEERPTHILKVLGDGGAGERAFFKTALPPDYLSLPTLPHTGVF